MTYRLHSAALVAALLPVSAFAQGGFNGPGRYEITNLKSGRVIDLDSNDGRTVIQFESRGTNNQTWEIRQGNGGGYYIINGMNGSALTATSDRNNALLEARPLNRATSQEWRIENGQDGLGVIVNQASGKAIDVPNGTNRNGQRLQIYDKNSDTNQRFSFRSMGASYSNNDGYNNGGVYNPNRQNRGNRGNRRNQGTLGNQGNQGGSVFDDPQSGNGTFSNNTGSITESTVGSGSASLRGRSVNLRRSNVRVNGQNANIDFDTDTGNALRMTGRVVARDANEMRVELRNIDNQRATGTAYVRFRRNNNEVREISVDGSQNNSPFNLSFNGTR